MVYETNIKDNSNTQDNIRAQKWTKQTNTGEEATATLPFPGSLSWYREKCLGPGKEESAFLVSQVPAV